MTSTKGHRCTKQINVLLLLVIHVLDLGVELRRVAKGDSSSSESFSFWTLLLSFFGVIRIIGRFIARTREPTFEVRSSS